MTSKKKQHRSKHSDFPKSAKIAPKRQRDEARLVEAVLEQLQGMSVIKSFNLTGKGDKRIRQALEDSRENNLAVEKLLEGKTNRIICTSNGAFTDVDIDEGLSMVKRIQQTEVDVLQAMTGI